MAASTEQSAMDAVDTDTSLEELLLASSNHDLDTLKKLLRNSSARVQDPETGFSPLHAAINACEADGDLKDATGDEGDAIHSNALSEDSALATVQLLFENGAIWNELDNNDETPGCVAWRLGLKKVYESIVAAGVRAELLFSRLDQYAPLADNEGGGEEDPEDDFITGFEPTPTRMASDREMAEGQANGVATFEGFEPAPNPSYKIDEDEAAGAAAQTTAPNNPTQPQSDVQTDQPTARESIAEPILSNPNVNSEDYLRSELTYSEGRLLDSDKNAVMMDWETEIMKASADKLCPKPGLRTMNIGFGMGIVDSMFVANSPEMHHIIEAHPAVMAQMRERGWYDKPNVTVHEGRWQDVLPKLVEQGVVLDALYYDTYAEDYKDLKELFTEYVIALLDSKGLFGFYNGLGADRQICYDVYTKVVELDLFDAGLDVDWTTLAVPDLAHAWDGIRRPYWVVDTYRLPTCKFVG